MVTVTNETVGYFVIGFTATLSDEEKLIETSEGKLYAVLYDGESLISQKEIASGATVTFDGLAPSTLYQYAIVATYDAIDGGGMRTHILMKKALYTESALSVQLAALDGVSVPLSISWKEAYTGEKTTISLGLYEGDTLLRELSMSDTVIDKLPFDKSLHVRATYTAGMAQITETIAIESPQSSLGLAMTGDVVTEIGSCTDTVLYINHSIGAEAFINLNTITAVYIGEGVEFVGDYAFEQCEALTTVYLAEGVSRLGERSFCGSALEEVTLPGTLCTKNGGITLPAVGDNAFNNCKRLEKVTISEGVTTLGGRGIFGGCSALSEVMLPSTLTRIENNMFVNCTSLREIDLPGGVEYISDFAFAGCSSLQSIVIPISVRQINAYALDSKKVQIYCEAASKPAQWDALWNNEGANVTWGYQG